MHGLCGQELGVLAGRVAYVGEDRCMPMARHGSFACMSTGQRRKQAHAGVGPLLGAAMRRWPCTHGRKGLCSRAWRLLQAWACTGEGPYWAEKEKKKGPMGLKLGLRPWVQ